MNRSSTLFSYRELQRFAEEILLQLGADSETALLTAEGLVNASLRGIDSHGVRLLSHYVAGVEGGRINPTPSYGFVPSTLSTGVLDADHTFGHAAGIKAMKKAITLAHEAGTGWVSVMNSTHCGALAFFAGEACLQNMIGIAMTHATARVPHPAGRSALFGNNPLCIMAPMEGEEPFCYDSATTAITFNKVNRCREEGLPLPPNTALDASGRITTDPSEAAQLLPIGGYKGFGLSMVVDLFCAMLSGMPAGQDVTQMFGEDLSTRRYLGHFFGAIKVEAFLPADEFGRRLKKLAEQVRAEPPIHAHLPVIVPGDPEKDFQLRRLREGIPLTTSDIHNFEKLSEKYKIRPPTPSVSYRKKNE